MSIGMTLHPRYAYDDAEVSAEIALGSLTVTAGDIVAFAREFDPQPFHLDEDAGRASLLGGLAASGWHVTSLFMRLYCDGLLLQSTAQGAAGVDFVKWRRPVHAGDTLTGTSTFADKRLSKSRPGLGLVSVHSRLVNQRGELVCEFRNTGMMLTRAAWDAVHAGVRP